MRNIFSHYRSISIIERQLKREMIWQNPSFHRFSSGYASCCNWRTRQAGTRASPVRDFILWCLTWWQAYPFAALHPLFHLTNRQGFIFSWNSVHVFVPHGSISSLRSHHLVRSSARLTALHWQGKHKLSKKSETSWKLRAATLIGMAQF